MNDAPTTRMTLLMRLRDRQDRDAWASFVDLYGPLVYGLARRHGLGDADAADRVQEVLLAVARGVERYDQKRGPFRKWLYTVTMNKLRNFWKQRSRSPHAGDAGLSDVPDPTGDPDERWDREYMQRVFAAAADIIRNEVQPGHWHVFWQFAVEDKSGAEVAASCGVKIEQVYVIRQRVQQKLAEAVAQLWEE